MNKYFALAGLVYAGIGLFLGSAVYLRGNASAYTTDQNWYDAVEVGLVWPWHVLKYLGLVA